MTSRPAGLHDKTMMQIKQANKNYKPVSQDFVFFYKSM
jgi:hypothetical protein